VHYALEELRSMLDGERIDYAELVVLGARAKTRELRADSVASRKAREWLAREVREGTSPVDIKAAEEVKYLGLIANYDE
jgi:hypothetical protein